MRYLYSLLLLTLLLFSDTTQAQWVTWASSGSGLVGTFPGGTVTVTATGTGQPVRMYTPALGGSSVVATGNSTFSTFGPTSSPPSRSLTFTFSVPVIITRYNMSDIDVGSSWNDTFAFSGVTFTSVTAVNCNATTTGVTATTDVGSNAETARWATSTTPITSFSINYATTGGRTHAYLAYALEVMLASVSPTVTVNSPTVCGTELATVTATPGMPGSYSYEWTVPAGVTNPGNVASFTTTEVGTYSVIITDLSTGEVSSSSSGTVTYSPSVTTTFNQIAPICAGDALLLPLTSNNGVIGTWSPAIDNTQTTTYTFTPASDPCASTASMTVVVNPRLNPTFIQVADICSGTVLSPLPTTSNNGVTGSWSPALDNTQTTTYTFTPTVGLCANNTTMTIVVNPILTPAFTQINPTCYGASFALPTISNNGVSGVWSPMVNDTATTTYTFTPNPGECAVTTSMEVVVFDDFDFDFVTECENTDFLVHVTPVANSFDGAAASYNWFHNGVNIGTDNAVLNVTSHLNATTATETLPITFDVIVTDLNGCQKTRNITLNSIYCEIQNGISPNGDNLNEFFDLRLLGVSHLSIFNRYGVKVYDKENYTQEWIGQTNDGNELPTGTYYYLIDFKDDALSKSGWIYINR